MGVIVAALMVSLSLVFWSNRVTEKPHSFGHVFLLYNLSVAARALKKVVI